jgi:hypothetical protein
MLRKLLLVAALGGGATAAYVAAPVIAAWQIREAVRTGDAARLRDKVDWPAVRQSLKASIGETKRALTELTDAAGLVRPSLWQRLKAAALPYVTDPLIDRYVTADGVPKLYAWRQAYLRRIADARRAAGAVPAVVAAAVTPVARSGIEVWLGETPAPRFLALARRIDRWSFVSPTRFELELADRPGTGRRWRAVMEIQGLAWRLTGMRIIAEPTGRHSIRREAGLGRLR